MGWMADVVILRGLETSIGLDKLQAFIENLIIAYLAGSRSMSGAFSVEYLYNNCIHDQ